jgi:choline kinase
MAGRLSQVSNSREKERSSTVRTAHASHSAGYFGRIATFAGRNSICHCAARNGRSKVAARTMKNAIDRAVLLVAGVGSRLRPLTDEVPKALVEVSGVSMLERAVATLHDHGVRHYVFATGYREEAVRAEVARLGIRAEFCHNPRYAETQNSISLLHCRPALENVGFYKLDGDVLFAGEILERLDGAREPLGVAVDGNRKLDAEAMKVSVDREHRITRFGKSIELAASHGESIGIERISAGMSATLFSAIGVLERRGIVDRYYEDVYSDLIGGGSITASAIEVGDLAWAEIDDHADLKRATAMFPPTVHSFDERRQSGR